MNRVTHYAGELFYRSRGQSVAHILPGWAACCSGSKAERIRAERSNTRDRAKVTCKACLRVIERADAYEREAPAALAGAQS